MVDITDVLLNEGKRSEYVTSLQTDRFSYRFGKFPLVGDRTVRIVLENIGDKKLLLEGEASLTVMIPCARCLKPVKTALPVQFSYETELEETEYIDGYNLNVDQLIHDESLLVWPERVLCREDCKGLCSSCGHDLNEGPCGCSATELDPRMAKILDIFNNSKEV